MSAREAARQALVAAKKKAEEEGRPFDETEFIIQLVESKRKEYEQAKLKQQQQQQQQAQQAVPEQLSETLDTLNDKDQLKQAIETIENHEEDNKNQKPEDLPSHVTSESESNNTEAHHHLKELNHHHITEDSHHVEVVEGDEDAHPEGDEEHQGGDEVDEGDESERIDEYQGEEQDGDDDPEEDEEEDEGEDGSEVDDGGEDDDLDDEEEDGEEEDNGQEESLSISPDIGDKIRAALLTAKEKAIANNKMFDEPTAILIAQEMLARAARMTQAHAVTASNESTANKANKTTVSNQVEPPQRKGPVPDEDQMLLAMISARKKAQEDGKPFYEEEWTKSYYRKKKKEADDAKFAKVGAKAKLHFGGESDGFFRDQAVVAAKEARRIAIEEGKAFDEDEFMVQFILNKRREAAMARGVVVKGDKAPVPVKPIGPTMSVEERRKALLDAVHKEHPTSSTKKISLVDDEEAHLLQQHQEQIVEAAVVSAAPVANSQGSTPSTPSRGEKSFESSPGLFMSPDSVGHTPNSGSSVSSASPGSSKKSSKPYNRSVLRFYEAAQEANEEEHVRRQLAIDATRRAVSEELKVIEDILTAGLQINGDDEEEEEEDNYEEEDSSHHQHTGKSEHSEHTTDKRVYKKDDKLAEILASKRAKEDVEEAARRATEKAREDEKQVALHKAREEAALKKQEQEAKKKQAEAAHKLALARDQARFNIMLARRKAAADGIPFDEEAYIAAEAARTKDAMLIAALHEKEKSNADEKEKEKSVAAANHIPEVEPEPVPTKKVSKGGVVKKSNRTGVPKTGVVLKQADPAQAATSTAREEASPTRQGVKEVESTPVSDDRREQIERARKLASEKQKEILRMKGKAVPGETVPDSTQAGAPGSSRKAAIAAMSRAEAVARAREMARSKGRTISTHRDNEKHVDDSEHHHDQSSHSSTSQTHHAGSHQQPATPAVDKAAPVTLDSTNKSSNASQDESTAHLDSQDSQGTGSGEIPELEDALQQEMNAETEKIKQEEIERQREIEELRRLRAAAKEKAPKKQKKKPPTFWDTLFMCTPKDGADTK